MRRPVIALAFAVVFAGCSKPDLGGKWECIFTSDSGGGTDTWMASQSGTEVKVISKGADQRGRPFSGTGVGQLKGSSIRIEWVDGSDNKTWTTLELGSGNKTLTGKLGDDGDATPVGDYTCTRP